MKKNQSAILKKLRFGGICVLLLSGFLFLTSISASAQRFNRRSSNRTGVMKMNKYDKRLWRNNILWLEGMGASQVISLKYERIFVFGRVVSMRAELGLTPFCVDHRYDVTAGRNITPITGIGFYFFPNAFKVGIGCSVLHDIYFDRIPETVTDTTHGGSEIYEPLNYRVRVMPFIVVEGTINNRWIFRAGYSPIIDPANEAQTETYFTHWATLGLGYKFGK